MPPLPKRSILTKICLIICLGVLTHACKKDEADDPTPVTDPGTTAPVDDLGYTVTAPSAYEEFGKRIITSSNGDYIIVGTRYNVAGSNEIMIMRVHPANGDFTQVVSFGGGSDEAGCDILELSDNSLLVAGTTASQGAGQDDFYLAKTTASGVVLWDQTYGGSDVEALSHIKATPDGNYMLCGFTESFGSGSRDMYVVKVDPNGNELWSKTFGGVNQDGAMDMVHNGTNWMILGFTYSFGAGDKDFWLLEMNANGDSIDSKTFGGPGYEEAQSIVLASDGGYLLHGHSASNDPSHNIYSVKVDTSGAVEWQHEVGGISFHDGGESAIAVGSDFYIMGNSGSYGDVDEDVVLTKLAPTGSVSSEMIYGGVNREFAKDLKADGSYLIFTGYQLDDNGQRKVYMGRVSMF
jgi:hypothetical protein